MKLTQTTLAKLQVPQGKSELIEFDENMPGFGLRIRKGNNTEHRTFVAQYKIGGKHRRVTLGDVRKVTLENARREAKKIFGRVAIGEDPAAGKIASRADASRTLDGIIDKYLAAKFNAPTESEGDEADGDKSAPPPRSHSEAERYLRPKPDATRYWKPITGMAVSAITRATVAAQVREIANTNGPVAANRARGALSAMFRWAIGEGLCDSNPVIGTNKLEENGPRERSLSDAEAAAVWLAAPEGDYGNIVRLILLTGCRRTEIGGLRWSEIDTDAATITIPGERTKNGQTHTVPLSGAALAIVKDLPRRAGREFVFGSGAGGYSGWSKSKTAIDKVAALPEAWTLHDLRRTVRTGLGMLGVAPHVAEAVLNHLPAKLIRTYDRNTYAAEKAAALELWANHLAVAVAKASGANVTQLPRKA